VEGKEEEEEDSRAAAWSAIKLKRRKVERE